MSRPFSRKALPVAALALAASIGLAGPASAGMVCNPVTKTCKYVPDLWQKAPPPKPAPGWGYGAAALGGMAVGAMAVGAANAGNAGCYVERRRAYDEDGNVFIRRVRVCE